MQVSWRACFIVGSTTDAVHLSMHILHMILVLTAKSLSVTILMLPRCTDLSYYGLLWCNQPHQKGGGAFNCHLSSHHLSRCSLLTKLEYKLTQFCQDKSPTQACVRQASSLWHSLCISFSCQHTLTREEIWTRFDYQQAWTCDQTNGARSWWQCHTIFASLQCCSGAMA